MNAYVYIWAFQVALWVKKSACNAGEAGDMVQFLGGEDPLEEGKATHSSILAWRIPMDRGAWRATAHGVSKSQTQLKRLCTYVLTTHTERCLFSADTG